MVLRSLLLVSALLGALAPAPTPDPAPIPAGLAQGWYASVETNLGRVLVRLLPDQAPQSVAHFVGLAEGTLEWTDPLTGEPRKGKYYEGGKVYEANAGRFFGIGERAADETYSPMLFVPPSRGPAAVNFYQGWRVANVKVGSRMSAARIMFLITPMPVLNEEVPCFGEIVDGREVAFSIAAVKTAGRGRPIDPVTIERIRIFAVGDPPPLPAPVAHLPEPAQMVPLEVVKPPRNP
jgi:peptidyl-prolyl cis-trans isomerase A (cyclophilin A)